MKLTFTDMGPYSSAFPIEGSRLESRECAESPQIETQDIPASAARRRLQAVLAMLDPAAGRPASPDDETRRMRKQRRNAAAEAPAPAPASTPAPAPAAK